MCYQPQNLLLIESANHSAYQVTTGELRWLYPLHTCQPNRPVSAGLANHLIWMAASQLSMELGEILLSLSCP